MLKCNIIYIYLFLMDQVKQFVHSEDFWKWHGFVLSVLWLFGSSLGIFFKKKSVVYHLLTFFVVDYTSLFFMGGAIYLIYPQLSQFLSWGLAMQIHVVLGLIMMGFMLFEHFLGAITWHKETSSKTHRKLGRPIALAGRMVAGIGWVIQADNTLYAAAVLLLTAGLYIWVDRKESKAKTN